MDFSKLMAAASKNHKNVKNKIDSIDPHDSKLEFGYKPVKSNDNPGSSSSNKMNEKKRPPVIAAKTQSLKGCKTSDKDSGPRHEAVAAVLARKKQEEEHKIRKIKVDRDNRIREAIKTGGGKLTKQIAKQFKMNSGEVVRYSITHVKPTEKKATMTPEGERMHAAFMKQLNAAKNHKSSSLKEKDVSVSSKSKEALNKIEKPDKKKQDLIEKVKKHQQKTSKPPPPPLNFADLMKMASVQKPEPLEKITQMKEIETTLPRKVVGPLVSAPRRDRPTSPRPSSAPRRDRPTSPRPSSAPRRDRPTSPRPSSAPRRDRPTSPRPSSAPRRDRPSSPRPSSAPRRDRPTSPRPSSAPRRDRPTSPRPSSAPRRDRPSSPRPSSAPRRDRPTSPRPSLPPKTLKKRYPQDLNLKKAAYQRTNAHMIQNTTAKNNASSSKPIPSHSSSNRNCDKRPNSQSNTSHSKSSSWGNNNPVKRTLPGDMRYASSNANGRQSKPNDRPISNNNGRPSGPNYTNDDRPTRPYDKTNSNKNVKPNYRPIPMHKTQTSRPMANDKYSPGISANGYQSVLQAVMQRKRPPAHLHDYDSESEYDSEMDDFIDDSEPVDINNRELQDTLRSVYKYDKRKFANDKYEDDSMMESSFRQICSEESQSLKIAKLEDLRELQREQGLLPSPKKKQKTL